MLTASSKQFTRRNFQLVRRHFSNDLKKPGNLASYNRGAGGAQDDDDGPRPMSKRE